jgi:hypothetical protein
VSGAPSPVTDSRTTKALLTQAVEASAEDPAYFLRYFLRHWFPSQLPPFHLGYLALMTGKVTFLDNYPEAHDFLLNHFNYEPDPREPALLEDGVTPNLEAQPTPVFVKNDAGDICLVAPREHINFVVPRGFSKTTLTKGAFLYELITNYTTYGIFLSATATHAEAQLQDIKTELETNSLLREAYGNQVPTRADSQSWTGDEIQLLCGSILVARGRGGQVRGLTYQGKRPNKVCLDDVEDEDSIATSTLRDKTKRWFYGSVAPAGQLMEGATGESWAQEALQIINLGTLLGAESLIMDLNKDPTFSTVRFGARVQPNLMLWPFKMSEPTYLRMRDNAKKTGTLGHFSKEYDSTIRVDEDAVFPSVFHYVPVAISDLIARSLALDPAISEEAKADEAALIVAGRHRDSGALWFLDEWGGVGKSPTQKLDALFEYHRKWQTTHNGIEAVAYQAALLHLAREKMAKERYFFIITPIRPGSKQTKAERIVGTLSPRYKANFIYHQRPLAKLESGLMDWPNGRKDFADAAAMALNLLGETVGVVMDKELDNLPALDVGPDPIAGGARVGNYLLHHARSTSRLPQHNPRYGAN